jgi:hypothetical protein
MRDRGIAPRRQARFTKQGATNITENKDGGLNAMNQVAYILTSTSVAERVSDARALTTQLESLNVFDRVELVPAIFWNDEPAVARFLCEYPEHNFEGAYLDRVLQGQVCSTLSHIKTWRQLLGSRSRSGKKDRTTHCEPRLALDAGAHQ